MTIRLYRNTAEFNRVNKTSYLVSVGTAFGKLKSATSVVNPVVTIEVSSTDFDYFPNYAYIDEFKRWYFVTDVVAVTTTLFEFSLSVDVLMTYKDAISECDAYVVRTENLDDINPRLIDEKRIVQEGRSIHEFELDNLVFLKREIDEVNDFNYVINGYKFYVKEIDT